MFLSRHSQLKRRGSRPLHAEKRGFTKGLSIQIAAPYPATARVDDSYLITSGHSIPAGSRLPVGKKAQHHVIGGYTKRVGKTQQVNTSDFSDFLFDFRLPLRPSPRLQAPSPLQTPRLDLTLLLGVNQTVLFSQRQWYVACAPDTGDYLLTSQGQNVAALNTAGLQISGVLYETDDPVTFLCQLLQEHGHDSCQLALDFWSNVQEVLQEIGRQHVSTSMFDDPLLLCAVRKTLLGRGMLLPRTFNFSKGKVLVSSISEQVMMAQWQRKVHPD
jgi:hypothetical protein